MTQKMQDLLNQLLTEDELVNTGKTPQEITAARIRIHQEIHDARRQRAWAKAKAAQPAMQTQLPAAEMTALVAEMRKPITADEETPGGLDQLAVTVKECEAAGDFADLVFALVRFYRKAWGENRWGAIQAEGKPRT